MIVTSGPVFSPFLTSKYLNGTIGFKTCNSDRAELRQAGVDDIDEVVMWAAFESVPK